MSLGRSGQDLNLIWIIKNARMRGRMQGGPMKKAAPERRGSLTGRKSSQGACPSGMDSPFHRKVNFVLSGRTELEHPTVRAQHLPAARE
ncbi:hypothetical protein SAMN04488527_11434 [Aliiroseovarius crassostreae]|nr:hypothetical protein SAMN04488527_11434 [Aliiroseovarius crassostreae]